VIVRELIAKVERELRTAHVVCAHGTDTCFDEAAFLVYHALGLDHDDRDAYSRPVAPVLRREVEALVRERIASRKPAAYLLGETWFAGLLFEVSPKVLIPRSPIAELIRDRFVPWFRPGSKPRLLEIGTGSGCIAVALAIAFPEAEVYATDIDWPALDIARRNVRRHDVGTRVQLIRADLLRGLRGPFDLIVSNPPYVPDAELESMPAEFTWEPRSALAGGEDGLQFVRPIVECAPGCLSPGGWLAIEVGGGMARLEAAFPKVAFFWPEFCEGGDGVALISAEDLAAALKPA
jgi:ribosomal protein L3 glutamine methyltransferase